MTQSRIGILGGTFDPIHVGHLEAAAAAQRAVTLNKIVLMPSMTPPHRQAQPQASAFHRFAMVALAVADREDFFVSDDELRAPGPSYTVDTLTRLHRQGLAPTNLFFILGSDAFIDIAAWHQYPQVLDAAHFVVVTRPGTGVADIHRRLPQVASRLVDASNFVPDSNGSLRVILVEAATPDVSSTGIRRCVAAGESLTGLTPPSVVAHIARHGLYQAS